MKLVFRINLLFAAIVSAIMLALAFLVFAVSRENVHQEFRQRLKNRAARTAQLYTFLKTDSTHFLQSLDATSPPNLFNRNINIYDTLNNILYEYHDEGAGVLVPDSMNLQTARTTGISFYRHKNKIVCLYFHEQQGSPVLVLVAAENITGNDYINQLKKIFFLVVPLAILLALVAGYLFSKTIIRPIRETIRDVELITSQNLSHRLFTGNRKDELSQLNATFNNLLNRLEESFTIQRRFISNASHELSTPLTSISSQIEVSLLQGREPEEYKAVLRSVLEDVLELQQLTRNLLEIAKAGTNGEISLDRIRVDEVLIKAHSDVLKQNKSFLAELAFDELPEDERACMVFGNFHLLYSAFRNILENGCKYSPDATIKVSLRFEKGVTHLIFSNQSDTMAGEEISRLFEPFYRGKNAGGKPGTGLGLTLTRRIIAIHKGQMTIESTPDNQTVVHISLPTIA